MSKKIDLKDAKCTGLSLLAPVLLKKNDDDEKVDFEIEAYTGAVVERWFGKLVIEIAGIKAKAQIPVLFNHDRDFIVGYSTETSNDKSFFVIGKFSEVTEKGKEVKGLAEEGFPWQASIGVRPVKVVSLGDGAKETVNGKTVKGPAEVWLESEVFETSFVPLGADGDTSVSTFSKFDEKEAPSGAEYKPKEKEERMEYTMGAIEKDAPELLAEIQTAAKAEGHDAGVEQERTRVNSLLAIDDADPDAKAKAIGDGVSVDAAYKMFFEAEKGKKAEELAALAVDTPEGVGQSGKVAKVDGTEGFMAAVTAHQKENKCTRTQALKAVASEKPELHAAFLGKGA